MDIFSLKIGESGKIKSINVTGSTLKRLNSLGFEVGKTVKIISYSLFKSAVLAECGSIKLGMRKKLAQLLEIEKCRL